MAVRTHSACLRPATAPRRRSFRTAPRAPWTLLLILLLATLTPTVGVAGRGRSAGARGAAAAPPAPPKRGATPATGSKARAAGGSRSATVKPKAGGSHGGSDDDDSGVPSARRWAAAAGLGTSVPGEGSVSSDAGFAARIPTDFSNLPIGSCVFREAAEDDDDDEEGEAVVAASTSPPPPPPPPPTASPPQPPRPAVTAATLAGNLLLVSTLDGGITALSADTGKTLWVTEVGKPLVAAYQPPAEPSEGSDDSGSSASGTAGSLIVPGRDGSILVSAPASSSGAPASFHRMPYRAPELVNTMPMAVDGNVLVGSKTTTVFEVCLETGRVLRVISPHDTTGGDGSSGTAATKRRRAPGADYSAADPDPDEDDEEEDEKVEGRKGPASGAASATVGDGLPSLEWLRQHALEDEGDDAGGSSSGSGSGDAEDSSARPRRRRPTVWIGRTDFFVRAHNTHTRRDVWNMSYSSYVPPEVLAGALGGSGGGGAGAPVSVGGGGKYQPSAPASFTEAEEEADGSSAGDGGGDEEDDPLGAAGYLDAASASSAAGGGGGGGGLPVGGGRRRRRGIGHGRSPRRRPLSGSGSGSAGGAAAGPSGGAGRFDPSRLQFTTTLTGEVVAIDTLTGALAWQSSVLRSPVVALHTVAVPGAGAAASAASSVAPASQRLRGGALGLTAVPFTEVWPAPQAAANGSSAAPSASGSPELAIADVFVGMLPSGQLFAASPDISASAASTAPSMSTLRDPAMPADPVLIYANRPPEALLLAAAAGAQTRLALPSSAPDASGGAAVLDGNDGASAPLIVPASPEAVWGLLPPSDATEALCGRSHAQLRKDPIALFRCFVGLRNVTTIRAAPTATSPPPASAPGSEVVAVGAAGGVVPATRRGGSSGGGGINTINTGRAEPVTVPGSSAGQLPSPPELPALPGPEVPPGGLLALPGAPTPEPTVNPAALAPVGLVDAARTLQQAAADAEARAAAAAEAAAAVAAAAASASILTRASTGQLLAIALLVFGAATLASVGITRILLMRRDAAAAAAAAAAEAAAVAAGGRGGRRGSSARPRGSSKPPLPRIPDAEKEDEEDEEEEEANSGEGKGAAATTSSAEALAKRPAAAAEAPRTLDVNGVAYRLIGSLGVSDRPLGFGCNGTVVFRGLFQSRPVAVKRMLRAFHPAAAREIELLVRSDGHPNVVRYFAFEEAADFLYLAIELCECSLADAVALCARAREKAWRKRRAALLQRQALLGRSDGVISGSALAQGRRPSGSGSYTLLDDPGRFSGVSSLGGLTGDPDADAALGAGADGLLALEDGSASLDPALREAEGRAVAKRTTRAARSLMRTDDEGEEEAGAGGGAVAAASPRKARRSSGKAGGGGRSSTSDEDEDGGRGAGSSSSSSGKGGGRRRGGDDAAGSGLSSDATSSDEEADDGTAGRARNPALREVDPVPSGSSTSSGASTGSGGATGPGGRGVALVPPRPDAASSSSVSSASLPVIPRLLAPVPTPALRGFLRELVAGVAHLHAHRIVHRDLKPHNILLSRYARQAAPATAQQGKGGGGVEGGSAQPAVDLDTRSGKKAAIAAAAAAAAEAAAEGASAALISASSPDPSSSSSTSASASALPPRRLPLSALVWDPAYPDPDFHVLPAFVPKISDFGLGKQLSAESSSYGHSRDASSLRRRWGASGGAGAAPSPSSLSRSRRLPLPRPSFDGLSTGSGTAPGSVGWQAPELLRSRAMAGYYSSGAGEGGSSASPLAAVPEGRRMLAPPLPSAAASSSGAGSTGGEEPDDEWSEVGDLAAAVAAAGAVGDGPALLSSPTGASAATAVSPPTPPPPRMGPADPAARQSRAADVWSLGCILFHILDGGGHPYGGPFDREANALRGNPVDLDRIAHLPEARDLIGRMVDPDPRRRPGAAAALEHPFFWGDERRLAFLGDLSDRLEKEAPSSPLRAAFEWAARDVCGGSSNNTSAGSAVWTSRLPPALLAEGSKHRRYDAWSMASCLRFLRNRRSHFTELPETVRRSILGGVDRPSALMPLFLAPSRFPRLLLVCYEFALRYLAAEPAFRAHIGPITAGRAAAAATEAAAALARDGFAPPLAAPVPAPAPVKPTPQPQAPAAPAPSLPPPTEAVEVQQVPALAPAPELPVVVVESRAVPLLPPPATPPAVAAPAAAAAAGVPRPTAASGERGWYPRSEAEWGRAAAAASQRVRLGTPAGLWVVPATMPTDALPDAPLPDPVVVVCAYNGVGETSFKGGAHTDRRVYKSTLCADWETSGGRFCRRGARCDFAHGGVELRWGGGAPNAGATALASFNEAAVGSEGGGGGGGFASPAGSTKRGKGGGGPSVHGASPIPQQPRSGGERTGPAPHRARAVEEAAAASAPAPAPAPAPVPAPLPPAAPAADAISVASGEPGPRRRREQPLPPSNATVVSTGGSSVTRGGCGSGGGSGSTRGLQGGGATSPPLSISARWQASFARRGDGGSAPSAPATPVGEAPTPPPSQLPPPSPSRGGPSLGLAHAPASSGGGGLFSGSYAGGYAPHAAATATAPAPPPPPAPGQSTLSRRWATGGR